MESDDAIVVTDPEEMLRYLDLAREAHDLHARTPGDRVRRHDGVTPYFVHPAWAAFTITQEPGLSIDLRWFGFRVLILHDVEEDTTFELPDWVPAEVREHVTLMSFENSRAEMEEVWSRPERTRLFKLYDKVSNLLDATWMDTRPAEYRQRYEQHTLRLVADVEENFGSLNICRIARALCEKA